MKYLTKSKLFHPFVLWAIRAECPKVQHPTTSQYEHDSLSSHTLIPSLRITNFITGCTTAAFL